MWETNGRKSSNFVKSHALIRLYHPSTILIDNQPEPILLDYSPKSVLWRLSIFMYCCGLLLVSFVAFDGILFISMISFFMMFENKVLKLHRKNTEHLYLSTIKNELISDKKEVILTYYRSFLTIKRSKNAILHLEYLCTVC